MKVGLAAGKRSLTVTAPMTRRFMCVAALAVAVSVSGLAGCRRSLRTMGEKRQPEQTRQVRTESARAPAAKDAESGTVLRVNDESVTAEQLWKYDRRRVRQARKLGPREFKLQMERRAAQLIKDRVTDMLLYQHARRRLPPEADPSIEKFIDGEIRKIITAEHGGVQRRFEKDLTADALTIEDIREQLRREIVVAGFLEREIKPKVAEPTRAELAAVFEQNRERWRKPVRRSMSLIDIRIHNRLSGDTGEPTTAQRDAARKEAESLVQSVEVELRNGADFAELAKRHSDGLHATDGGAWGWVEKGSVRERFAPAVDALYRLAEGEVSPVIEGADAFFLVRCDQLEPAVDPRFQDVQPALKERYLQLAYNQRIADLMTDLRSKARITPQNLERFHEAAVQAILKPDADGTR